MGRDIKQLHPRLQQKIAELKQMCSGEGLIDVYKRQGIFFIIPAAFLLSSALGITGVWLAFQAAELLALLLGLLLYRRNRKVLSCLLYTSRCV